jgi:PST family polysaccharide transporter
MTESDKKEKRVLAENFVAVTITQIITYVFPLITLPYLSRVLGAEKFGLVFWAQATMTYGNMLTDFGFNNSAVREFSIHRDNKDDESGKRIFPRK